jgi:hypothetical protein
MTTSAHASLSAIERQSQADHLPSVRVNNRASIGLRNGAGRVVTSRAGNSTFRTSRLTDYIVVFAFFLIAMVEIWRRLKDGIFDSYRPELHYMRGPGPKSRERYDQSRAAAPIGQQQLPGISLR